MLAAYAEEHGPDLASDAARETLAYNIEALLGFWASMTASQINGEACRAYAAHRQRAPGTVHRELSVLSAAMGHAVAAERLEARRPMWMPAKGPGRERWLTRAEAAALLRAARAEPQSRMHLPLFILLGLYGGARPGAILELRWDQIDLERGRIDWRRPDGRRTNKGRARTPIPRRLMTFLRLARRRGWTTGPVVHIDGQPVGSIKKSFAAACRRAGLEGVTPHVLRHTCGTWLAQAGVPLWDVAGYLGHTQARTTELYAHHSPDHMGRAAAALDGGR